MPSVSHLYPKTEGQYMKSSDITEPIKVTIIGVGVEPLQGDEAIVLAFKENGKKLRLNVTNARELASRFGDAAEMWVNKVITLASVPTTFEGKNVKGIRVV